MMGFLLVGAGAFIGGALRHGVNLAALRWLGPSFPAGTLAVNVVGSLAMGLLAGWLIGRAGSSEALRLFAATGILGGFTTFSAFSLDAVSLWERGEIGAAAAYVALSVGASIGALIAGLAVTRALA